VDYYSKRAGAGCRRARLRCRPKKDKKEEKEEAAALLPSVTE
jgi:hypothetical protein